MAPTTETVSEPVTATVPEPATEPVTEPVLASETESAEVAQPPIGATPAQELPGGGKPAPGKGVPPAPTVKPEQPADVVAPPPGRKPTVTMIATAVVLVCASGAGYYYFTGKPAPAEHTPAAQPAPSAGNTSGAQPAPPAQPAVATVPTPAAEQAASVPSQPPQVDEPVQRTAAPAQTTVAPAPVPAAARVRPDPAPPKRPAATPKQAEPSMHMPQRDTAEKSAALLARAESYLASHQYEKAIATGESVLLLEPDNAAAGALIRRAKARQLDALKSGTSLD